MLASKSPLGAIRQGQVFSGMSVHNESVAPLLLSSFCQRPRLAAAPKRKHGETQIQVSTLSRFSQRSNMFPSRSKSIAVVPRQIDDPLYQSLYNNVGGSPFLACPEHTMFVSEEVLRQLSVYDGTFVFCCVRRAFSQDHESSQDPKSLNTVRLVRIVLLPDKLNGVAGKRKLAPDTVLINPLLELNLGIGRNSLNKKRTPRMCLTVLNSRILGPADKDWQRSCEDHKNILPKETSIGLASHAKIVRLTSVGSDGRTSYADALTKYFSKPRLVMEGDVFAVLNPSSINSGLQNMIYPFERPNIIFFQVASLSKATDRLEQICSSAALSQCVRTAVIDRTFTKLIQGGSKSMFVPDNSILEKMICTPLCPQISQCEEWSLSGPRRFYSNDSCLLPVDSDARKMLLKVAKPFFESSSCDMLSNMVLVYGPRGVGKCNLVKSVASSLSVGTMSINYKLELAAMNDVAANETCKRIVNIVDKALESAPCILHLRRFQACPHIEGQTQNFDGVMNIAQTLRSVAKKCAIGHDGNIVFIVLSSEHQDIVDKSVRRNISFELHLPGVCESSRKAEFSKLGTNGSALGNASLLSSNAKIESQVDDSILRRTAGRSWVELKAMMATSGQAALKRLGVLKCPYPAEEKNKINDSLILGNTQGSSILPPPLGIICDRSLSSNLSITRDITPTDLESAVTSFTPPGQNVTGNVQVPNVKWDDVGGLGHAKNEIMDMINLPMEHPELFGSGMKQRSGILLYGPPGTGKTLMAKAVATECGLNFLSVKGPELLNMYIGESEKNVREVFEKARNARPCVIFFDELDSLAPARGRGSDGGGVMDRVVSQLLTEIDGLSSESEGDGESNALFVIGATNRPDLLDSSLLRPGRFDRLIYLGIASDRESQVKIIRALTRKFSLAKDATAERITELCPDNFTGADFYALCSNALAAAIRRRAFDIRAKVKHSQDTDIYSERQMTVHQWLSEASPNDISVEVSYEDFKSARESIVPSVSLADLRKYEALRKQFSA